MSSTEQISGFYHFSRNNHPQSNGSIQVTGRMSKSIPPITLVNGDVLREVFLYFSKYDLLEVTCVCWEWHHMAQVFIDQTLELVASRKMQEANLQLLQRIRQNKDLQHRVKHFVVNEWHLDDMPLMPKIGSAIEDPWMPGKYFSTSYAEKNPTSQESQQLLAQVCHALKATDPASFTWSALVPMPTILFKQLALRPSCDVHIRRNMRAYETAVWTYAPILNHTGLGNIANVSGQLKTLELLLPPNDPLLLASLGNLISSSPKLKSLKLYSLGKLFGGFKVHIAMRPVRGSQFAITSSMEWLCKPLAMSGRLLALEELELDHFCICGAEDFHLSGIIDLSKLHKIGLSCFSFLEGEISCSNLKSFRLHCHNARGYEDQYCLGTWSTAGVRELLSRCDSLKQLELLDGAKILNTPLLEAIGSSLTSLSLHRVIWNDQSTTYDLATLSNTCPKLQTLDIDIPTETERRNFISRIGSSFPKIKELTICRGQEGYIMVDHFTPDPYRFSTILADVDAMFKQMAIVEPELVRLTLQFEFLKPWDRDAHFFSTGRPYAAHCEWANRTYIAEADFPGRMAGTLQQVRKRCIEAEEATKAIKHHWQWPKDHFDGYNNWEERLRWCQRMANERLYLVLRRTPNPNADFMQAR